MNIILIGMRGSGKSSTGEMLAGHLRKKFIETDRQIEEKMHQTVSEIVGKSGWNFFRKVETEILNSIKETDSIISAGGGIIEKKENRKILKKLGKVVWLKTGIGTLYRRIGEDQKRPLITGASNMRDDLKNLLLKRNAKYRESADIIIDTSGKSVKQVMGEILSLLKS